MVKKLLPWMTLLMLISGCMPASQQEVMDLHNLVGEIIPVVREVAGAGNAKIEKVLADVERVNEAVATAPDAIGALEKGWNATKDINPYYVYGTMAIGLLKLWQKKRESDGSLEEVVLGVEDSKKNGTTLTNALLASNSIITRKKVSKILNG